MSLDTFTPEVWSKVLLSALQKALVYAQPAVVNRDYEGDISEQGDTVNINSVGDPTIATYVKGVTTIVPEQLTTAQRTLIVDQAKYFAFEVDDIDKRQNAGNVLTEAMKRASYRLRDQADQFVAALYTGVQAANFLNAGVAIPIVAASPNNAYDNILVPLKVVLDEANVMTEGRYCVIPPWFHGRLLRDDRFIRADASGQPAASINGFVGRAAGFELAVSNNTPNPAGDDNIIQAGVNDAVTFAEQINKTEAYRPQDSFSDAVKGLYLYGAKVTRPDSFAVALASQT